MRAPPGYRHHVRGVAAVLNLNNTVDGIVTVADHVALRTSQDITMSAWARAVSTIEAGFVCGRLNNSTAGGYGLYLDGTTNPIRISLNGLSFGPRVADYAMPPNEFTSWHHYAVSFNGSAASGSRTAKFYLDGRLLSTQSGLTDGIPHPASVDYLIGNRTGSAVSMFGGDVWDNRLYTRILSDTEVAKLCVGQAIDDTGLVLHLPLDDASGTVARNLARGGVGDGALGTGCAWRTKAAYPEIMPFRGRSKVL